MRLESLVIADEDVAVNTNPIFVHTARHVTETGCVRRDGGLATNQILLLSDFWEVA